MNVRFNPNNYPLLSTVINTIETNLKCSKFSAYSHLIDIDVWENIKNSMPQNKNIAEKGFGFCISNYYEYGDFKRIIIINMEKCNELNLSQEELSAIVYHELGHLLNAPTLQEEPTFLSCWTNGINYDRKLYDDVKEQNSIKTELFADYYATYNGYGAELISTFQKHNQHFENAIGHFEIRVEKINNNDIFSGSVKPIKRHGWE